MNSSPRTRLYVTVAALFALMVPAAPALAEEPAAPSTPVLHLGILSPAHTGQPLQFSGESSYTSPEQLYLTVFLAPPQAHSCPAAAVPPPGSSNILSHEEVDNFLSITDLSENIPRPGQWFLCGYLTNGASTTITSSSLPVTVTGSAPKPSKNGHQASRSKKHGKSSKKHKHH